MRAAWYDEAGTRHEIDLIRDGCATGWEKCPHAEPATVVLPGDTMTSCVSRDDVMPIHEPQEAPKPRRSSGVLLRDVRAAEADWGRCASKWGDDNGATISARGRWRELRDRYESQKKLRESS